jgi:hypothetical protein
VYVNFTVAPSISEKYLHIGPKPLQTLKKSTKILEKFPNFARALVFCAKTLQPLQKFQNFSRTS